VSDSLREFVVQGGIIVSSVSVFIDSLMGVLSKYNLVFVGCFAFVNLKFPSINLLSRECESVCGSVNFHRYIYPVVSPFVGW
jgi:hypothetical protein